MQLCGAKIWGNLFIAFTPISVNINYWSLLKLHTCFVVYYCFLPDWVAHCLTVSGRIPCPHPGRIWLEQRGLQRALYWHIEARVVLDLQEFPNSVNTLTKFYVLISCTNSCIGNMIQPSIFVFWMSSWVFSKLCSHTLPFLTSQTYIIILINCLCSG
jgi:hypothetical protein